MNLRTTIDDETWKDVCGYEGFYQISNKGRIRSCSRTTEWRNTTRSVTSKILKQYLRKDGYMQVSLKMNEKKKTHKVHRLVAEAFLQNPSNKIDVDHIDGNTKNNNICNLRWATRIENLNNKKRKKEGGRRSVRCIDTGEEFESLQKASESYSIHPASIGRCCKGYLNHAGVHKDTNEKLKWEYII